jgi:hypothetical protein
MSERPLVLLPNRDLWRGYSREVPELPNVEATSLPRPFQKLDEAVESILQNAKGGHQLTCVWCGTQFPVQAVKQLREHLKDQHPSQVNPPTEKDLQAAAALMASQK